MPTSAVRDLRKVDCLNLTVARSRLSRPQWRWKIDHRPNADGLDPPTLGPTAELFFFRNGLPSMALYGLMTMGP